MSGSAARLVVQLTAIIGFMVCISCAPISSLERSEATPAGRLPLDAADLERRIHDFVNTERTRLALDTVLFDVDLAAIARNHSEDMAVRKDFSHTDPVHGTPSDRASAAGYTCEKLVGNMRYSGVSENIALHYAYSGYRDIIESGQRRREYDWLTASQIARDVVVGWMESPGHRANIVDRRVNRQGIGVFVDGDRLYITQNLC